MQKIELHNNLITFTITTTVAILSYATKAGEARPLIYLFPFFIIIPMSHKIAYYRSAMSKLAAYAIVFIEPEIDGISWETRNNILITNSMKASAQKSEKNMVIMNYYECLILSIVCYGFSFGDCWFISNNILPFKIFVTILGTTLFLAAGFITYRTIAMDKKKDYWLEEWQKVKKEESEHSTTKQE